MWQLVKPHCESLLAYFIFPQMCFSDSDAQLWSEDPVEFVHKKIGKFADHGAGHGCSRWITCNLLDPLEDFHSAQMHASNLLIDMARHRRKQTFMTILTFTNELLTKYLETAPELRNGKEKDGALNIVGCLSNEILSKVCVAKTFFVYSVCTYLTFFGYHSKRSHLWWNRSLSRMYSLNLIAHSHSLEQG